MDQEQRFGESDHGPLPADDLLAQAIGGWRDHTPDRDLWPGIASQLTSQQFGRRKQIALSLPQMALAASLLMAVASGVTWLASRPHLAADPPQQVVLAESEPGGRVQGDVLNANFADDQFNAAVIDLEEVLRTERDRLDPRTVLVIERNLRTIDEAIREARLALDGDPANTYLNSHLADARRRKIDLLRRATSLASAGGD